MRHLPDEKLYVLTGPRVLMMIVGVVSRLRKQPR
jgi:hypothetical protein